MDISRAPESFCGLLLRHRGRTGLIQRDLAVRVGVSLRSVQDWEAGVKYPTAERLEALIRALLEAGGLTMGREALEAHELWTAAERDAPRMHTPFDEEWFAELLAACVRIAPAGENALHRVGSARPGSWTARRVQDWGEAPDTTGFVGRAAELAQLRACVLEERCRLLAVLGFGGIGKTSLAVTLAQQVAPSFERVYWRGLRDAPPVTEWLVRAIGFLSDQDMESPAPESERMTALVQQLRARRCLIVLDDFETLFDPGQGQGVYRTGTDGYGRLLQAVAETSHQSCLVLISRETPPDLVLGGAVRALELHGLETADAQALLSHKQLHGDAQAWTSLVYRYGGNGLALKIVAETIRQVYDGDLAAFLSDAIANSGTVFGGIRRLLDAQLQRLTPAERDVLARLAIEPQPIGLADLVKEMAPSLGRNAVIDAVETLRRRSLVERGGRGATFTLQSIVLDYVVGWRAETVAYSTGEGQTDVVVQRLIDNEPKVQAQGRVMGAVTRRDVRPTPLRGRAIECAVLDNLVGDIRRGQSRSLVLRGQAGIGKTALLEYLVESASDLTILRAVGIESEMELAFASLHPLCGPILDRLATLPDPQRQALEIVFGLSDGPAPDQFFVGLAALRLFSEVARERPLLCVVDDAQWLDRASAVALALVARRLLAEPVGVVFAAREPGEELARLLHVEVHGLLDGDARALLDSAVPFKLDEQVRERIIAETQGNPLALLELPKGLTMTQLAGGFGLVEAQALTGRIEQTYIRRLRALSSDARRLLLLASADPAGDPLLLLRAAERLGIAVSGLADEVDGLLALDKQVLFRHPLVRSAVYRSAALPDRQAMHLALADATDPELDPDRRAWHLAAASTGPDEQVAVALEHSAGRAQARGGVAAAAAFLQRALALTQDASRRADRALAAAQASVLAGAFDTALKLLSTAEAGALDELQRVRLDLLRAHSAFAAKRGQEAIPLLLAAAQRLEPLDTSLARETYLDAFSAALFGARLNDRVGVLDVAQAARAAPRRAHNERGPADLLLDALVALTDDYEMALPLCREALQNLSGDKISAKERLRWLWQGCVLALEAWDDETAYFLSHHNVQIARDTGTLSELALALSARAPVLVFCGDFSAAASAVAETRSVEDVTGISSAPYGALILEAWRGRPRETRELIDLTLREAGSRGEGIGLAIGEYARAVLCNGLGRYDEALVAARSASDYQEVVAENWGLSELIEPAVRVGRTDLASDALNRLAKKAHATRTHWALGIEARSRALLSQGERAEQAFLDAINHLGQTLVRSEHARTLLLYGEWLVREKRFADARVQLRAANEQLTSVGMEAFAQRVRKDLQAMGEQVREPDLEKREELTAEEAQIARLASDGLSNPEIGARLFLSPQTVDWHLSKVLAKLAIRSRQELAGALPGADVWSVPD